jgi:hypothetical protein
LTGRGRSVGPLSVSIEWAWNPEENQMKEATHRTHVVIPEEVVSAIDAVVGARGRSRFLVEAAQRELRRLAQAKALQRAAGAWKPEDHPELEKGAAVWVASLRSEGERRLGGATRKRR